MRVFRRLEEVPLDFGPAALTIGNFDGVHAGHRRILRRVKAIARARGLKAGVLTFDPHPTKIVAPARAPRLMTTPEQRTRLMEQEEIEEVLILPFTSEIAHLSPEEFVARILVERLQVKALVIGDNFRFGYRQSGNTETLRELGVRWGFSSEVVPGVELRGVLVSSSVLRRLIGEGRVSRAARLLERAYALEGKVIPGRGVGSKQTVPTLNLATGSEVLPASGVYVTRTRDLESNRAWESVTNIGYRPTFGQSNEISIESFLMEPLGGPAPARIRVEFLWRVREERKFESPEVLKRQILRDVGRAQAWFRRVKASVRCAHAA